MDRNRPGNVPILLAVLLVAALCGGCAVGVKHRYHDSIADLRATGAGMLVVAVQDARSYVVNAEKAPSFVGLSRGGYGNPFDVTTETGRPLATDMAESMCQSLQRKGYGCVAFDTQLKATKSGTALRAQAVEEARHRKSPLVLFLVLNEWKSDTYMNTALLYDVTLTLLKTDGSTAAAVEIRGRDHLGGSGVDPPGHSTEAVPIAFKSKIEQLLNAPKIVEAMRLK